MTLQQTIRRILREEMNIPKQIMRRFPSIDWFVNFHMRNDLQNDNTFIIHKLGFKQYFRYIVNDVSHKVWTEIESQHKLDIDYNEFHEYIKQYIESKFGDKLEDFYNKNTQQ